MREGSCTRLERGSGGEVKQSMEEERSGGVVCLCFFGDRNEVCVVLE